MIRALRSVHDLVRSNRITPAQVLKIRAELAYARKPWWERALRVAGRVFFI